MDIFPNFSGRADFTPLLGVHPCTDAGETAGGKKKRVRATVPAKGRGQITRDRKCLLSSGPRQLNAAGPMPAGPPQKKVRPHEGRSR